MPNHHQISVKHQQNHAFDAQIDQYQVPMDSTDEHSSNYGASPKKMMLAALAGCTGIDVVYILNKMKVNFSQFSIDVDAQLTEEHPVIYDNVSIVYHIRVEEADKAKMEKAVMLSKEKYCGVSAMFSHFSKIEFKIVFL